MGITSSRLEDAGMLHLRDQARFTIASVTISNAEQKPILHITPNAFPATRYNIKRAVGDETPIEFVMDPDLISTPTPSFILRLLNDDGLNFRFTFIVRQTQSVHGTPGSGTQSAGKAIDLCDTSINGLTLAQASTAKELENLVTREFHANPNLQNNANVQHVGDYTTSGTPSIQFEWTWMWRPPKTTEDKGGGWRNSCSFLEYDQRANRLKTLAGFSFWVHNPPKMPSTPQLLTPGFELPIPHRTRLPSSQSVQSKISVNENQAEIEPSSPAEPALEVTPLSQTVTNASFKVDVSCQRPGEDMSAVEDGPVFRATMKALEQKTGNMRIRMKKVLRKAEAAQQAQAACNDAVVNFMAALREASSSNANAVRPAIDHYFEKIAREILHYEQKNTINLQKLIIDPISKLYNYDIKQAESKKKDFEDESRDYYAYVSRYLGQRQDSLKEKKRVESDSKYQTKRRNFELRRFDYSSFMQDLHGGRKEQEVLSHLTKYADSQARSFLATSKKIEEMVPQLEALTYEVDQADKEFNFQRTEREEKRRILEKSSKTYIEPENVSNPTSTSGIASGSGTYNSDNELGREDGNGLQYRPGTSAAINAITSPGPILSNPPQNVSTPSALTSPSMVPAMSSKFRGIRDLEETTLAPSGSERNAGQYRKEGLLWALSRPGLHIDPKGINKQAWHKFWIVLDQGKLSEYSNWKQRLDLHMDPIDLRMASVREARNAERRFCFEVITPQYKRTYQATSEEDMNNWINAINNALQSAMESHIPTAKPPVQSDKLGRDIGSILTGKSSSYSGHHGHSAYSSTNSVTRRTTVGARPTYTRTDSNSFDDNPSKLLQVIRDADQGNKWCADCGSVSKVEWVSINLGIVLCIECSGIHRSLGTHISKIRSLTLDVHSFSSDIVEILLQVGNRVSNMIWEARLDQSLKPTAQSTREQRLKFISAKYSARAYVDPIPGPSSQYSTADETLLASVKKNDLRGVLFAIASKANVNAGDRSRNTHVVFLALAAADPAAPGGLSTAIGAPEGTSGLHPPSSPKKLLAFPVAELLVQNGAEIPVQLPAIPLSVAAKLYVEQRTSLYGTLGSGTGDTLGALPTIRGLGGGTHASLSNDRERERESRLQKRGSAGSRFAGKVSSLGSQ